MQLLNLNDKRQEELPVPQTPKWWRSLLVKVLYFILKDVLLKGVASALWNLILVKLLLLALYLLG